MVFVASLLPAIFWIFQESIGIRFSGTFSTFRSFGQLFGLVGISMFAVSLFLSARLKFFDKYFDGLSRAYDLHHFLGGLAFVFILFHPLFLALAYFSVTPSLALSFLFFPSTMAVNYGRIGFLIMFILLILTFYYRTSIKYQNWKLSHKLLGVAFFFGGLHSFFITSDISTNMPLRWYILILSAVGIAAYFYRTLLYPFSVRRYLYKVSAIKKIGDDVVEITMVPIGEKIKYQAGQFAFLSFQSNSVSKEPHPFSLTSRPEDDFIQIGVKSSGDYTKHLINLSIGDTAEVEGAFGIFSPEKSKNRNQIWIAGGIGITPFVSVARSLNWKNFSVDLYYSFKEDGDGVYLKELEEISEKTDNLRIAPWISQKMGRIDASKIKRVRDKIEEKVIFICGPSEMIIALKKDFINNGVLKENIFSEEFNM